MLIYHFLGRVKLNSELTGKDLSTTQQKWILPVKVIHTFLSLLELTQFD